MFGATGDDDAIFIQNPVPPGVNSPVFQSGSEQGGLMHSCLNNHAEIYLHL